MTDTNEQYYDDEIAPALLELCKKCNERGMPFVAAVEWKKDIVGLTSQQTPDAGLAIIMIALMARSAPNFDSFYINFIRWCREANVDTSQSMIVRQLEYAGKKIDEVKGLI